MEFDFRNYCIDYQHTGSRVISNPAPRGTDDDWIVYLYPELVAKLETRLKEEGYHQDGKYSKNLTDGDKFHSWKIKYLGGDSTNILITCDREYFDSFSRATALARRLNLTAKEDRIALFEAVTRDVWPKLEPDVESNPFEVKKKFTGLENKYTETISGFSSGFQNNWGIQQPELTPQPIGDQFINVAPGQTVTLLDGSTWANNETNDVQVALG